MTLIDTSIYSTDAAIFLVVPTTHWDRAWYWTADRFRARLIEMFLGVEAMWERDPDWRFTLDGQTIALEDYLEVFPEKATLYRRMVRSDASVWDRFTCKTTGGHRRRIIDPQYTHRSCAGATLCRPADDLVYAGHFWLSG